ncbi:hypothetical protein RHMOL_Rhmol10G0160900 [Rhododendron molle]|uniref:Uncharacterized protein n=1 Tax=Rhododendron molle TaxID=49168 RepID=A0ACC0M4K2_RHOML|nr:hypothetical protein RHMOL_Rhmol10G0160900 [Rhododendron molle]
MRLQRTSNRCRCDFQPLIEFWSFLGADLRMKIRKRRMVVDLSSDSSSSSESSFAKFEAIHEEIRIRALYRTPLDYIELAIPFRAPRQVTTFDTNMTEAPSTSNLGQGPFANSPEEVRGRKRPMRSCPFLGQYFNGTPTAYAEFKRVFSIPLDIEVRLLQDTDPKNLPYH